MRKEERGVVTPVLSDKGQRDFTGVPCELQNGLKPNNPESDRVSFFTWFLSSEPFRTQ